MDQQAFQGTFMDQQAFQGTFMDQQAFQVGEGNFS